MNTFNRREILIALCIIMFGNVCSAATNPSANQVTVNTSSFTKNLNSSDSNVQAALQTIDQISSGGGTPGGTTGQFNYNNNGVFAGGNMYASGSYIGVNKTNPSYQFDVNGIVNSSGGYIGIQVNNVPTLNQNTTGTASGLSGSQGANTIYSGPNGSPGTASFRTLVGADLPNPSASTKGGVQAVAQVSHQWINSISNSGVPVLSQPSYSDLSGSPAAITGLTGDVTATGPGSVPATLSTVNPNVGTFQGITVNGKGLVTGATNQGYITGNQPITVSHSGDMTGTATGTTSLSIPMTLNTVNSNTGSFGSSTAIPNFTVNGKGLITAAGTNVVVAPAGTLTGSTLASGVTGSSITSVGTIGNGVWHGTPIGYQYGGNGQSTAPSNNVLVGNGSGWTLTTLGSCSGATSALTYNNSTGLFGCNAISGGVSSVTNSDGSLTISPNSGAVFASLNTTNANTWTGQQIFNSNVGIGKSPGYALDVNGTVNATAFIGNGSGLTGITSSQWNNVSVGLNYPGGNVGIGSINPQNPLTVNGSTATSAVYYSSPTQYITATAGVLIDPNFGGTFIDITAGRNVGIGTLNPGQILDVNGTLVRFRSPNNSTWSCGPNNSGTWACTSP